MARQELKVFISSPGDVQTERKVVKAVVNKLNMFLQNHILVPYAYEDATPPVIGNAPQSAVNKYMIQPEDVEIFVCILWSRMGTPYQDERTGENYLSGTEYEFSQAYKSIQAKGRPITLLYRCNRPIPVDTDTKQLEMVQNFFTDFMQPDSRYKGIFKAFTSVENFEAILQFDLMKIVSEDFSAHQQFPLPDSDFTDGQVVETALSIEFIRGELLNANKILRNHDSTIGISHSIGRMETSQIIEWVNSSGEECRLGLLIDKPGTGKTVVMSQVLQGLEAKSIAVLAIKADYLSGVKTNEDLQQYLKLPLAIEDCVSTLASGEKVVILIDQIDSLSISLSQDFSLLDLMHSLVLKLIGIENVRVIISCREFDLKFDPNLSSLSRQKYYKFTLSPLSIEQITGTLQTISLSQNVTLSPRLRHLLSIPLYLKIYADLVINNPAIYKEELYSLQQLYEYLWNQHVLQVAIPYIAEVINILVESIQNQGNLSVPIGILDSDRYKPAIIHLLRVNLVYQEKGNYIFFHQTFFDYCYVRRFISEGHLLSDTVFKSAQGLFERAQILQVLSYLRASNTRKYLEEIQKLLFDGRLRIHLRILLIEWFASLPDPHKDEDAFARGLLKNPKDQVVFLNGAAGNVGWFDKLNNGVIASLLHSNDDKQISNVVVNYVGSLINQRQEQILALLKPYQGRTKVWDGIILYCLSQLENWNDK